MRKLLAVAVLMCGVYGLSHAGTPQETYFQSQFPFSNVSIVGSTVSVSAAVSLTKTVAAPTCPNGASGRNCFTNFIVQVPTTTIITFLDGTTTTYSLAGVGLASSGVNTLQINRDHLGPLCTSVGNSSSFVLTATGGVSTNPQGINYEGYTNCGGSNNAGN